VGVVLDRSRTYRTGMSILAWPGRGTNVASPPLTPPRVRPSRWSARRRMGAVGPTREGPSLAGWPPGRALGAPPDALTRTPLGRAPEQGPPQDARAATVTSRSADGLVWGIPLRDGYDELDDPSRHRGRTAHGYVLGDDRVAACGYRPPSRGLLRRRPAKLGFPSARHNPKCPRCARQVVAPIRGRFAPGRPVLALVPVPVGPERPRVHSYR
jgi:hypothetical protein